MSSDPQPTVHVSTGQLPPTDRVRDLITSVHERYATVMDGALSTVYPALTLADPEHFGISVVSVDGEVVQVGDTDVEFTIMSVAKPFVFALACQAVGADAVRAAVGVNATGMPFNSLAAIEAGPAGRTNPMVNPGAIATTGLVPGATHEDRWDVIRAGLSSFAGRDLPIDAQVFASASATNYRNQSMARLLQSFGRIAGDPAETVDLYTRQSCLSVTARDLAVMGATLADGGVNPITRAQVVDAETCRVTLAVMATAGLYETSGEWLYTIGLPGKSGIGGGIVTSAPGKGGLGTYSPLLDAAGNSVRGQLAARHLSQALGFNLFASAPAVAPA